MAKTECTEGECEKTAVARGMCPMHYRRWRLQQGEPGTPLPPPAPRPAKEVAECSIGDCTKPVDGLGLCAMHYTRKVRNGDPLIVRQIRGDDRARFESYVDRSGGPDACHPWTGSVCSGGYGQLKVNGKLELAHVLAWQFANDRVKPPKSNVDHECHNRAVKAGACHPGECPHRLCCNEAHLAAKTTQEHRDDTQQWEMPTGPRPVLTPERRAEIRMLLAAGETGRALARRFGVHPATITHIKQGRRDSPPPQAPVQESLPFP